MAEEVVNADVPTATQLVAKYGVPEVAIAELRERCKGITFDTPENYEKGRLALGQLRELRAKVEKRRKELKADSLEYGRRVDAAARKITGLIEDVEEPLQEAKKAVDEAERKRKEEEERAELIRLDLELRAKREQEEAEAARKRKEEEERLAAERKLIAEEQVRIAEQQRVAEEAARIERERQTAERKALETRERAIAEREAAARSEQEQREAEERAKRGAAEAEERARLEAARVAALAPDIEKVHAFAGEIRALARRAPMLKEPCSDAIEWVVGRLETLAGQVEAFKP